MNAPLEPPDLREPAAARWLLLLLLCPALIWGCWSARFLRLDDSMIFSWGGTASFTDAFRYHPEHQVYYPLTLLSWWFDKTVWVPVLSSGLGESAWAAGIRIGNVLLHALAAVFLWQTLRALRAPSVLAGFVTAGFALHPTVCESVCWAVERKNVMAGCFTFAAFWLYVRAAERGRGQGIALAVYTAALLSKPSALALFPILLAWEALGRPALDGSGAFAAPGDAPRWKPAALRLLPWGALACAFGVLGYVLHENLVLPPPGGSLGTALLTDAEILRRYLQNFAWPARLSFFYGVTPIVSPLDPRFWGNTLALAAAVSVSVLLCEPSRRRGTLFAWAWFVGGMATSLNLISISFLMQDRYVYLSAPGLWLAAGLAVQGLFARLGMTGPVFRRLAAAAVIVAALTWTLASATRSRVYAESVRLFEDASVKQPESSYARILFAQELDWQSRNFRNKGQGELANAFAFQAIEQYQAGIAAPDFERYLHMPAARLDLALLYYDRGMYAQAAAQAEAALKSPEWRPLSTGECLRAERMQGMAAYKQLSYAEALSHFSNAANYADPGERENLAVLSGSAMLDWANALDLGGEAEKASKLRADAAATLRTIGPGSPFFETAKKLLAPLSPQK